MADAWLAICFIYVLHTLGEPPTPAGELDFQKYDKFRGFQTAVVDEVVKTGSFSDYKRRQLEGGFFFKLPHPADGSRPERPEGKGLVPGSVELSSGDCILLDISNSVPAAPGAAGAAGGGGGSDVAASAAAAAASAAASAKAAATAVASMQKAMQTLPTKVVAALNAVEAESTMSDVEYEEHGRGQLFGLLVDRCGLEVVHGSKVDRPDLEGTQWDFRAPVRCAAALGNPGNVPGEFEAFLSVAGYRRPPQIATRIITPTKVGTSPQPPAAEYLAVIEITKAEKWTRGERPLLPRLEERLSASLDRAQRHGYLSRDKTILDLVAVVGVVSPYQCSASVRDLMEGPANRGERHPYPMLKSLMDAGRFVFFKVPKRKAGVARSAPGAIGR